MVIQFISFCVFIALLLTFMYKMYKNEQYTWYRDQSAGWKEDWRSFGYAICVSCIGIFVRHSIFFSFSLVPVGSRVLYARACRSDQSTV